MPHADKPIHSDPFLDEVRELKRRAVERSGGDLRTLFQRLREIENQHRERVVTSEQLREIKKRHAASAGRSSEIIEDQQRRKAS